MELETLWTEACDLLQQDIARVSYDTWIGDNLVPMALEDDCLLLTVKMEPMRDFVVKQYKQAIDQCLTQAGGKALHAELLTREEMEQRLAREDAKEESNNPRLNPKYTFDRFVVGSGNRFAHAAALAVAENPAEAYNPLFIYGGVGLGKTHLMQAIGHFAHEKNPDTQILYMTSETFTNELISAIQQKKTYEFREKIRKVDILMVDDIQFIAGRESTQQEFFNTFNELHNAGKQIILTSDKPPKDIQRLEERLCSRFEWGLVADIQRPDVDTRVAILRDKAQRENIEAPDEVLQLIAGKIENNVRELEGGLTRLVAYSNMVHQPITMELCEAALQEIFDQRQHKQITAELIMRTVSDYYGLSLNEMTGATRRREITVPRQIAMYLTREMTGMSLPQIGNVFGGRDHTTVLHSCKTVESNLKENKGLKSIVEDIKQMVKNAQ
ncbi:MAG: chromosomal replication initiator protein DnaA [Clostridia bacterium]|nr:chromosomal replication initiator protein DnaA [Clostridia bacterium]MBQ9251569.1 chromosomal replication initiator protein DnaA [Clostridia bacterium]